MPTRHQIDILECTHLERISVSILISKHVAIRFETTRCYRVSKRSERLKEQIQEEGTVGLGYKTSRMSLVCLHEGSDRFLPALRADLQVVAVVR